MSTAQTQPPRVCDLIRARRPGDPMTKLMTSWRLQSPVLRDQRMRPVSNAPDIGAAYCLPADVNTETLSTAKGFEGAHGIKQGPSVSISDRLSLETAEASEHFRNNSLPPVTAATDGTTESHYHSHVVDNTTRNGLQYNSAPCINTVISNREQRLEHLIPDTSSSSVIPVGGNDTLASDPLTCSLPHCESYSLDWMPSLVDEISYQSWDSLSFIQNAPCGSPNNSQTRASYPAATNDITTHKTQSDASQDDNNIQSTQISPENMSRNNDNLLECWNNLLESFKNDGLNDSPSIAMSSEATPYNDNPIQTEVVAQHTHEYTGNPVNEAMSSESALVDTKITIRNLEEFNDEQNNDDCGAIFISSQLTLRENNNNANTGCKFASETAYKSRLHPIENGHVTTNPPNCDQTVTPGGGSLISRDQNWSYAPGSHLGASESAAPLKLPDDQQVFTISPFSSLDEFMLTLE